MGESDPGMTGKHCSAHWSGLACWVPVLWPLPVASAHGCGQSFLTF